MGRLDRWSRLAEEAFYVWGLEVLVCGSKHTKTRRSSHHFTSLGRSFADGRRPPSHAGHITGRLTGSVNLRRFAIRRLRHPSGSSRYRELRIHILYESVERPNGHTEVKTAELIPSEVGWGSTEWACQMEGIAT